jgi:cytochrome c-type biogenesis protein CcmH/NrfF
MGMELWQAAVVAVVVVLWVLFVYLPRRTGEDTPPEPPGEDRSHDHEGGPRK